MNSAQIHIFLPMCILLQLQRAQKNVSRMVQGAFIQLQLMAILAIVAYAVVTQCCSRQLKTGIGATFGAIAGSLERMIAICSFTCQYRKLLSLNLRLGVQPRAVVRLEEEQVKQVGHSGSQAYLHYDRAQEKWRVVEALGVR